MTDLQPVKLTTQRRDRCGSRERHVTQNSADHRSRGLARAVIGIEKIEDNAGCQTTKVAREAFTLSRRIRQDQDATWYRLLAELLGQYGRWERHQARP